MIEPEWRDAVMRIARRQADTFGCDALVVVLETLCQNHALDAYVVRASHASIVVSDGPLQTPRFVLELTDEGLVRSGIVFSRNAGDVGAHRWTLTSELDARRTIELAPRYLALLDEIRANQTKFPDVGEMQWDD